MSFIDELIAIAERIEIIQNTAHGTAVHITPMRKEDGEYRYKIIATGIPSSPNINGEADNATDALLVLDTIINNLTS